MVVIIEYSFSRIVRPDNEAKQLKHPYLLCLANPHISVIILHRYITISVTTIFRL